MNSLKRIAFAHITAGVIIVIFVMLFLSFPGWFLGLAFDSLIRPLPELSITGSDVSKALATVSYGIDFLFTMIFDFIVIVAVIYGAAILPQTFLIVIFVFAIPSIAGSFAILRGRRWGRTCIRIVSALYLLVFPLGTALSIFTFIALRKIKIVKQPG